LAERTLSGSILDPETEYRILLSGVRSDEGYVLEGSVEIPEEPIFRWTGLIPEEVSEAHWGFFPIERAKSIGVSLADEPTGLFIDEIETVKTESESEEEVRYRGVLASEDSRVQFDVITDPDPVVIVVLSALVAKIILAWIQAGGRADCARQHAAAIAPCIDSGGTPKFKGNSGLRLDWEGWRPVLASEVEREFVCHQSQCLSPRSMR
jgi:hypothetical protein